MSKYSNGTYKRTKANHPTNASYHTKAQSYSTKEIHKFLILGFGVVLVLFVTALYLQMLLSSVNTKASDIREKTFTVIEVNSDDTLWSIAETYHTEECGDIREYIQEIRETNHLRDCKIYSGESLYIPYWTTTRQLSAN